LKLALVAPTSPLWYFARASGFVTLLLLTASVSLGIAWLRVADTAEIGTIVTTD
jgi:hypothetical protein